MPRVGWIAANDSELSFPASARPDWEQFVETHEFNRPNPDLDILNDSHEDVKQREDDGQNGERIRMLSVAIIEAQTVHMWGVKGVTW